jgi:hypothetical protein
MDPFRSNFWTSSFCKEKGICKICFEVAIDSMLTQCNHLFCTSCLKQWIINEFTLNTKSTCPMCCTRLEFFMKNKKKNDLQEPKVLKLNECNLDDCMCQKENFVQQLGLEAKKDEILSQYNLIWEREGYWFIPQLCIKSTEIEEAMISTNYFPSTSIIDLTNDFSNNPILDWVDSLII